VDPSTGSCYGGDSPQNCQFGNLGRNALRGPDFFWNDLYLTKWFPVTEHVKLRREAQFFNSSTMRIFGFPAWCWPAFVSNLRSLSADRPARGWLGRRQQFHEWSRFRRAWNSDTGQIGNCALGWSCRPKSLKNALEEPQA
jgi:hypothetical protein